MSDNGDNSMSGGGGEVRPVRSKKQPRQYEPETPKEKKARKKSAGPAKGEAHCCAFAGVTVGLMGSLVGIHWSLALSAMALLAITISLLAFTTRTVDARKK